MKSGSIIQNYIYSELYLYSGGKGRTGTMVCTWLLHCEAFAKANDALDYFASRRTDLSVSSKFQGVETPSQSRCVMIVSLINIKPTHIL